MNLNRYVLGVTGSIGCGKSYTCGKLVKIGKERGINIDYIDFDILRRSITQEDLSSVLEKRIANAEKNVLFEWALLVEDNLLHLVDEVLLVRCNYEVQMRRLINGDLSEREIKRRIGMQLSSDSKEEMIRRAGKNLFVLDSSTNPSDEVYKIFSEDIFHS